MKKKIITTILLSGAHLILFAFVGVVALSYASASFDNPEAGNGFIAGTLRAVVYMLGVPIVTPVVLFSIKVPDFAEWLIIGCNSLIWGLLGTFAVSRFKARKQGNLEA